MTRFLLIALALIAIGLAVLIKDSQELVIESLESKTRVGKPVFNKIKWIHLGEKKEAWLMNQSHHGPNPEPNLWERLAIVVDRTTSPATAQYLQLAPGPLSLEKGSKPIDFRVSCYMCHSNGPRAIRANLQSTDAPLSYWNRAKMAFWNLKIKSYGRVVPHPIHDELDKKLSVPLRWRSPYENEPLRVKSCTLCHNENLSFARGLLKRQNAPTIKFMLEQGLMPPPGFSISRSDRLKIQKFLGGF